MAPVSVTACSHCPQYQATKSDVAAALDTSAAYTRLSAPYQFGGAGAAVIESDSDGDFPASDPDSEDEALGDDSELFFDAVDRRAVSQLRMGERLGRSSVLGRSSAT